MLFYKAISYIFHPIVFSIISTLLYFIILPSHITKKAEHSILIIVFLSTYIVPILLLFFLKRFKMVHNFQLSTIEERKFPVLFMIVLFSLLGKTLLDTSVVDLLAYSFLGCALSLFFVYLLFFTKLKTSLHSLSIAGLIGFLGVISFQFKLNLLFVIILLFLIFGIVAVSRLKLKAHSMVEIYLGFFIGALPQILTYYLFVRYSM
tara:strand:+ start:71884 stop:72498 length:615 start_codon:yes stop_codon:yes gene_type:complete